jgi:hypothetical protein
MLGLDVGSKEVPKRVADVAVAALVGLLFADDWWVRALGVLIVPEHPS